MSNRQVENVIIGGGQAGLAVGYHLAHKDIAAAGIERVPRTKGVRGGYPLLEDGRVLEVSNVIWCSGFILGYHWIDLSLPANNGVPIHNRGIVESCPGLYFIGLVFLYSLSSALLGGVGFGCRAHRRPRRFDAIGKKGEVSERFRPLDLNHPNYCTPYSSRCRMIRA